MYDILFQNDWTIFLEKNCLKYSFNVYPNNYYEL